MKLSKNKVNKCIAVEVVVEAAKVDNFKTCLWKIRLYRSAPSSSLYFSFILSLIVYSVCIVKIYEFFLK